MRFLTIALILAAGVLAQEQPSHERPHGARGKICRLIVAQNPEVSLEDCKSVAHALREGCEADYPNAERSQLFECMHDGLHAKFQFVTPYEMDADQRASFVATRCANMAANLGPEHPKIDAEECQTDFLNAMTTCDDQSSNKREFRRCMREQFRAIHGGPHDGPHDGPNGDMHIFPGEEGPEEGDKQGEMHIFPGEEGPEEGVVEAQKPEFPPQQPADGVLPQPPFGGRHHGYRGQHQRQRHHQRQGHGVQMGGRPGRSGHRRGGHMSQNGQQQPQKNARRAHATGRQGGHN